MKNHFCTHSAAIALGEKGCRDCGARLIERAPMPKTESDEAPNEVWLNKHWAHGYRETTAADPAAIRYVKVLDVDDDSSLVAIRKRITAGMSSFGPNASLIIGDLLRMVDDLRAGYVRRQEQAARLPLPNRPHERPYLHGLQRNRAQEEAMTPRDNDSAGGSEGSEQVAKAEAITVPPREEQP